MLRLVDEPAPRPALFAPAPIPHATIGLQAEMHRLRVGIVEAREIYRRGLEAALADDSGIELVFVVAEDPPDEPVDVVVSSSERVKHGHGATVVCGSPPDAGRGAGSSTSRSNGSQTWHRSLPAGRPRYRFNRDTPLRQVQDPTAPL